MTQAFLKCGRFRLPVQPGRRPLVMGILNVTPDSFSDGGRHHSLELALTHAEQMIADGVDIIDI
ncbi:dihydropteroate synthase, partial [Pseudomonas promysalinigenes]